MPSAGISQWRLGLVLLTFAACTLALVGRIGYIQVIQHREFIQQADETHWAQETIAPQRGAIKDRSGHPLALSVATWEISLDFTRVPTKELRAQAVEAAAKATGVRRDEIEARLNSPPPARIAENVDFAQGKALAEAGLPGVVMQERVRRTYPEGSLGASLLGFVGRDRSGLTGLEADFDRDLAGVPGAMVFERDSVGNPIPLGYRSATQAKPGGDLVLTIDRYLQRIVERELNAAVTRHRAEGGTIIVMEPGTGAILALASRPTLDLRTLDLADNKTVELVRNRAITDLYEPGSTFKVITMASALNEGAVTPEMTHNDSGPVMKFGRPIDNWDRVHYGTQTMTQVLVRSNNVGAVWVADKLGPARFYPYVEKFGFGQPTYIGLSGEAAGFYRTPEHPMFSPIDLATNSFGQGITVTPLQMITATSAAVNGGQLMRPYIIDRIESPEGVRRFQPVVTRRVISEETSRKVRDMMKVVAEEGTSKKADVPGYYVGVKTGTANMIAETGGYSDATIASIVGFFPYQEPRAVVLAKLDHPKDSPFGSQVAAPVFAAIAREALVYWRVPPSQNALAYANRP